MAEKTKRMKIIAARLDEALVKRLDNFVERQELLRSQVLRKALKLYLDSEENKGKSKAA